MPFHKKVGKFLFGSDPGRKPREALTQFGLTGELGGQSQAELLNALVGRQAGGARKAAGSRLARAGLTGSGIAEDVLQDVDLSIADFLRKIQLDLIQSKLQALGISAGQPRQKGFLESVAPTAAKFIPGL